MSKIVREAITEKLLPDLPRPKAPAEALPRVEDLPKSYHCPVMGCLYQSRSRNAKCNRHGRTVQ